MMSIENVPFFPVFHFLLCFCSAAQHFSTMFPSCLSVLLSDSCIILLLWVLKSWQTEKTSHHKGSDMSSDQQRVSAFDMCNDIYILKEADEINHGPFTISDILTSLVLPHPLLPFPHLSALVSFSLSLFLHSQSFSANLQTYSQHHQIWYQVLKIACHFGNNRE